MSQCNTWKQFGINLHSFITGVNANTVITVQLSVACFDRVTLRKQLFDNIINNCHTTIAAVI